jgi:hypothetical protein
VSGFERGDEFTIGADIDNDDRLVLRRGLLGFVIAGLFGSLGELLGLAQVT